MFTKEEILSKLKKEGIRFRRDEDANYHAFIINGKTTHCRIDPSKQIGELRFPEFYDIKITNKCLGNCPYCYMDSKSDDPGYKDVVKKLAKFFKTIPEKDYPFQVTLGGGEPTLSPEFENICAFFYALGIQCSYTSNGMWTQDNNLEYPLGTQYCAGVALSLHLHLEHYWAEALERYKIFKSKATKRFVINAHSIVYDRQSIDIFRTYFDIYKDDFDYFVLLPLTSQGRARGMNPMVDYEYLDIILRTIPDEYKKKIAYGAKFYDWLRSKKDNSVDLYPPEAMSKFMDCKDMKIYRSSFDLAK